MGKTTEYYATRICLIIIRFYRIFISPLKPRVCRFYPSCSEYTYEAVQKYGICKGIYMGMKRILKCHPFNPGGFNPVE
ncbi:MAG: membrane protein insertion efficiency factor YidD [Bacillota bacterium]|nr:membrane protein insertion efficiency factor YidD [Bacillota bacterium]MDW7729040.1 membrane protein insertion efficiency factor YidD [Bacillota bacterium]